MKRALGDTPGALLFTALRSRSCFASHARQPLRSLVAYGLLAMGKIPINREAHG
jgi:hypothetical protein